MDKVISFLKLIFHISILLLIVISLFPGSLPGLVFYADLDRQPILFTNPFGNAVNHFVYYFCVTMLGLSLYLKASNFEKLAYSLFFLSIILEVSQFVVPNRAFEIYDVSANFIGVLIAYSMVKIYKFWKKL